MSKDIVRHINSCGEKYKVYLSNGKSYTISFIGNQLEEIFEDYNVKYEKVKEK